MTILKCTKHPFFEDLLDVSEAIKSFYNDLFSMEGDICDDFSFDWVQMRNIVEELNNCLQKLEKFTVFEV